MLVPDTTPYAWPYDGRFVPSRSALVVCGSGPTWSTRCPFDGPAEANIKRLRGAALATGVAVLLLRHADPARVERFAGSSPASLERQLHELEVEVMGIDGFYGSPLDAVLRALTRDQLLLVGRGFEATVHSTLRRGNDRGYECLTIADACVALDPAMQAASVSTIEMSGGIFGAVGTTDAVINTLTTLHLEALS